MKPISVSLADASSRSFSESAHATTVVDDIHVVEARVLLLLSSVGYPKLPCRPLPSYCLDFLSLVSLQEPCRYTSGSVSVGELLLFLTYLPVAPSQYAPGAASLLDSL
jgi:hypothetical protein